MVYTCRCPEKSTVNEDAAAIVELTPQHRILIVADAVGGRSAGADASHAALIAMAVEIGMLNEDQALVHEDRNLNSNCLGIDPMKIDPESSMVMAARDTLLIVSDGLSDNLIPQGAIDIVCSGDPGKSVDCLVVCQSQNLGLVVVNEVTSPSVFQFKRTRSLVDYPKITV